MNRIKIDSFAHNGRGIGKIDGKVVFVENAMPNETADVEIVMDKSDYFIAEAVKIIEASEFRTVPACPYYGKCGGCDMQHIEYSYQLQLKKSVLKHILQRIAGINVNAIDVRASDDIFNYRKRIKFQCMEGRWGFFRKKSREFIDIDECAIADKEINIYIKDDRCTNGKVHLSDNGLINSKIMVLDLSEVTNDLYLTYKQGAFTQINKSVNIEIIKTVMDEIKKEGIKEVFDFFGGIGNFSIPLAADDVKVTNFELNKKSVDSFKINVKRLGLAGKAFVVRKNLNKTFELDRRCAECVILDPPRAGAKNIINYIILNKPNLILYISCEPSTLARDLKVLKKEYNILLIRLFDMFPQTHHFETFVKLKRKRHI